MKAKGIKKAVGEFNNYYGSLAIYLDIEEMEVYTATKINWVDNTNADIALVSKFYTAEYGDKTTMSQVKKAITQILKQSTVQK